MRFRFVAIAAASAVAVVIGWPLAGARLSPPEVAPATLPRAEPVREDIARVEPPRVSPPRTEAPRPAPARAEILPESLPLSPEARRVARWVIGTADHKGLPFIVVDKVNAAAHAFDANARHVQTTPVLLGMGTGDVFPPGVADMDMLQTRPWQRVTPAGRYHASEDYNLANERVLWVDYDNGIALHPVPTKFTKQRRQERMRSPDPSDNRITYGCINVPAAFYQQIVGGHFRRTGGFVYVLPEKKRLEAVFQGLAGDEAATLARAQNAPTSSASPGARF